MTKEVIATEKKKIGKKKKKLRRNNLLVLDIGIVTSRRPGIAGAISAKEPVAQKKKKGKKKREHPNTRDVTASWRQNLQGRSTLAHSSVT